MHPKRLESRIIKAVNRANRDFGLITEGDKILVALSGGKDSYALLWVLMHLKRSAPFHFDLVAYHLDQGQPGHDPAPLRNHLEALGVTYEIEYQDTYTHVVAKTEPGKIYCSLCSRFRRAILYKAAARHGCNKVALGHHRDDVIETTLLNLFFSGQLKSMPPKLMSDAGSEMVIRPLVYIQEDDMIEFAQQQGFPILPCNLCGSLQTQRQWVKKLLTDLEEHNVHVKGNILNALSNVAPTHLLDKALNPLFSEGVDLDTNIEHEAELSRGRSRLKVMR